MRTGKGMIACLLTVGAGSLLAGCATTPSDNQSNQAERESFRGDPNKMPPEARQKMEAAMKGARTSAAPSPVSR